jgi:hypothetical protein
MKALRNLSKTALIIVIAAIILSWAFWSVIWTWFWWDLAGPEYGVISGFVGVVGFFALLAPVLGQVDATKPEAPQPAMKPEAPQPAMKPEAPQPAMKPEAPQPAMKPEPAKNTLRYEWRRGPRWVKIALSVIALLAVVAIVAGIADSSPPTQHVQVHQPLTEHERYVKRLCRRNAPMIPAIANLVADDLRQVRKRGERPPAKPPRADARAVLRLASAYDEVYRLANKETTLADGADEQAFYANDDALTAASQRADQLARQFGLTCITMTPPDK